MKKIQIEVEVPDFLSNGFIKALTMLSDEELMLVKVYTAGLLASKTGENFEPLMEEIIGNIKIKTQKRERKHDMKKLKAAAILCMCVLFAGCSGEKPETEPESVSESESTAVIPTLEALESSVMKSDAIEDIPDIEGFAELLQGIAVEMEIQPIETLTYIDCSEADGGTSCKFTFPYGEGEAYAYFGYDGEQWIAAWVIDAKKVKVYWIGDGMESTLPPGYGK